LKTEGGKKKEKIFLMFFSNTSQKFKGIYIIAFNITNEFTKRVMII